MTLVVGLLLRGSLVEVAWQSLLIQGLGLLSVALFCHHIYVKGQFVERGDPALSWCCNRLGSSLLGSIRPLDGSTFILVKSAHGMRQFIADLADAPSTHHQRNSISSGRTCCRGDLLEPQHWGIALGLILIQINTRPSILREWLMLALGGLGEERLPFFWRTS